MECARGNHGSVAACESAMQGVRDGHPHPDCFVGSDIGSSQFDATLSRRYVFWGRAETGYVMGSDYLVAVAAAVAAAVSAAATAHNLLITCFLVLPGSPRL